MARAGNVLGGGDWANDRLMPDIINALEKNKIITIRNPNAIRPWQHVLDCLSVICVWQSICIKTINQSLTYITLDQIKKISKMFKLY